MPPTESADGSPTVLPYRWHQVGDVWEAGRGHKWRPAVARAGERVWVFGEPIVGVKLPVLARCPRCRRVCRIAPILDAG